MQYIVQAGDTLAVIAQRFGTTVEAIVRANNIANPNVIFVGQVLTIPVITPPTPIPPVPVPPIPTPPVTETCPRLQRGSRGAAVRTLQSLLTRQGINPGPIDGVFGAKTEAAVRVFQRRKNLPVTGIVDVSTWTALGVNCTGIPVQPFPPFQEFYCPCINVGSQGPAVRFVQRMLADRGFYRDSIDGIYGRSTQIAVRMFQRQQGLTVTGLMDGATWNALGVRCIPVPCPPDGTPIATQVGKGLRHILYTDKSLYQRGENISLTLTKTNITDEEINLRYSTNQIIEITAVNALGTEVWRWSANRTFAQGQRLITIFPQGTQVINETWNQKDNRGNQVPSGNYTLTVTNLGTGVSVSVQIVIR